MDTPSSRTFTAYDAAWALLSIARASPAYSPRRSDSSRGLKDGDSRPAGQSVPDPMYTDDGSGFAEVRALTRGVDDEGADHSVTYGSCGENAVTEAQDIVGKKSGFVIRQTG